MWRDQSSLVRAQCLLAARNADGWIESVILTHTNHMQSLDGFDFSLSGSAIISVFSEWIFVSPSVNFRLVSGEVHKRFVVLLVVLTRASICHYSS